MSIYNTHKPPAMTKTYIIKELVSFTRPKICFLVTGLATSGYLLFNPIDIKLLLVAIWAFFATSATYSYNLITDKQEDMINHKKLNYFTMHHKTGMCLIASFIAISATATLFLSKASILLCIFAIITGIIYSRARIKEIFPMKNIYTAGALSIAFWTGALNAPLNSNMILYSIPITMLLFIASIISDLRDYKGDKSLGIKTVPVVIGYSNTQKIIYATILIFLSTIIFLKMDGLYALIPFTIHALLLLKQNKPNIAHKYTMMSFTYLPLGVLCIL